jgi:hypothetical protein
MKFNASQYGKLMTLPKSKSEKEQMMQSYEDGYNRVVKLIEYATQRNLNL